MKSAVYGLLVGLTLSLLVLRVLRSVLWGIRFYDPLTFAIVIAAMLVIAAFASLIPALRLAQLDPAQTLRSE
jgi:ABC-type antimicrobial peptide transport system permease subunit